MSRAGGLISYSPSLPALVRRAAVFIDRILRGAKPGDPPIEQPSKFELVVNMRPAKAMGVAVPVSVLARADQLSSLSDTRLPNITLQRTQARDARPGR